MAVLNEAGHSRDAPTAGLWDFPSGTRLAPRARMGLTRCTGCKQNVPDFARVCEHCGVDLEQPPASRTRETVETDLPFEDFDVAAAPVDPRPDMTALFSATDGDGPPPVRTNTWGLREVGMITFAVLAGGALTMGLLMARALPSTAVAAAPVAATTPPPKTAPTSPTHVWTIADSSVWVGAGKDRVAFELPADNTVAIWMRTVRPSLVVRCVEGRMDAFVFTASAARIEPQTEDHTIRYGFDDAGDVSERWPDSEEHDALFAPDGAGFAKQIAAASVLRFSFTPHNAASVTAQFSVAGLKSLLEPAARSCGWHK